MNKILTTTGLLAFCATSLFGGQIVQTKTLLPTALEVSGSTGTFTFNDFLNFGVSGATLTSVTLQLRVGEQLTLLNVTNTAATPQTFDFVTFSNLTILGTAPDKTAVKNALLVNSTGINGEIDIYDTGSVAYGINQTINYAPPTVNVFDDSGVVTAANANLYNTVGSFTLGFNTTTFSGASGGGGNFTFNQSTTGAAVATVIYNYTSAPTPEPATMTLFGSALLGIGFFARKRAKKS